MSRVSDTEKPLSVMVVVARGLVGAGFGFEGCLLRYDLKTQPPYHVIEDVVVQIRHAPGFNL